MKKRRTYQPRVFEGRVIMPDEIERIHKEVLEFESIEAISDPDARVDRRPVAGTSAQAATEEAEGLNTDLNGAVALPRARHRRTHIQNGHQLAVGAALGLGILIALGILIVMMAYLSQ